MEVDTEIPVREVIVWHFCEKQPRTEIEEKLLKPHGSKDFTALIQKHFTKLKIILMRLHTVKKKSQKPCIVCTYIKRGSKISYILQKLISFITSNLKTEVELKPELALKVLNCLLHNGNILVRKDPFNIVCTSSLKKFLANSLCCEFEYLLKDIATDILCEFARSSLCDTSRKVPSCKFHNLKEAYEDLYGSTVAWLSSMTPETGAKLVHKEALYSMKFSGRALNFPRMFARLVAVCESYVFCCLPSQIVNVLGNKTHSLYNLKLMRSKYMFYNLMRHEAIYVAHFCVKYEPRSSKPFKFSDLPCEINLWVLLESSCKKRGRSAPDDSCRPPSRKKRKTYHKNFYASRTCSLYRVDTIWMYWNVFYITGIYFTDIQLAFFGGLSPLPNRMIDIYSWEKAGISHISTSSSNNNPVTLMFQDEDGYEPY